MLYSGETLVNEKQRDGPNPLFHRAFTVSGINKIVENVKSVLGFYFSSQEVVVKGLKFDNN